MIEVKGLYKSYGEVNVLNGIDCRIKKGEVVALIGPSGIGKSTFLRCLNFLEKPEKGVIALDGYSVNCESCTKKEIYHIRDKSAMIFQNHSLFYNKNVKENIMLPLIVAQKKTPKEAEMIAEDILEKIGLEEKRNHYPSELSGGQQQRVGIGRAMALKKEIMLFDEPTSALDPALSGEVLELIRQVATERETTMLIVTHEIAFAGGIADRIMFMNHGNIIEEGNPKQLLSDPKEEETIKFLEYHRKTKDLW